MQRFDEFCAADKYLIRLRSENLQKNEDANDSQSISFLSSNEMKKIETKNTYIVQH
jgi:hypothetical protein